MKLIYDTLLGLEPGAPVSHSNVEMIPLIGTDAAEADYLLLDDALERGLALVREISEHGSVPELLLDNRAARAVLLLDGEELIGAKQNRVLNLSVLAPARTALTIPVSCVEAGRWHYDSPSFSSAKRAFYASGRARKTSDVSASLAATSERRSDQGAIWHDIEMKLTRMAVHSNTGAMADLYQAHQTGVDEYAAAILPVPGQVGAVFCIHGRICGIDLFDHADTMSRLMSKLVRSYAMDAIEASGDAPRASSQPADVSQFLADIANANVHAFPAIGEGEDLRLQSRDLCGGVLQARGRIVHLCAFRRDAATDDTREQVSNSGRMVAMRRRYRIRSGD